MLIMPADGGGPVELPAHPASTSTSGSGSAPKPGATGGSGSNGTAVPAGQVNASNLSAQQALLAAEQETA
ncbi:MAG: hypothetical protein KGK15_10990, partial [Burkholderiales bacterium]|nr:hypothetical protein [Burkholderiales bacterium]